MKKLLSLTLAVIMTVSCVLISAEAAKAAEIAVASVGKVKAELYSSNQVTVSWKKDKSVSGYQVYEKVGSKYKKIKTISKNSTTSYRVKKVSKSKTHTYAVRAYKKANGDCYYSNFKTAKVYVPKVLKRSTKGFEKTTAGKLIKTARKKLGSSYVSGAAGPNRFDCSGYVYYVTNKSKASTKKIKRTSASGMWGNLKKYSIGTKSLSKAQPGDIVFTDSMGTGRITHAAFYYGDGKYIHATNPRTDVAVTSARYYGKVKGIVRLPNL